MQLEEVSNDLTKLRVILSLVFTERLSHLFHVADRVANKAVDQSDDFVDCVVSRSFDSVAASDVQVIGGAFEKVEDSGQFLRNSKDFGHFRSLLDVELKAVQIIFDSFGGSWKKLTGFSCPIFSTAGILYSIKQM